MVIGKVIRGKQFAFVKGRQLMDCALIANEVIDILEKGQKGGFLFKVDFEKAYDSVDWGFLQFIMGKLGFARKWRKWIMGCLTTDNISVLVNGVPTEGWKEAYDRAVCFHHSCLILWQRLLAR